MNASRAGSAGAGAEACSQLVQFPAGRPRVVTTGVGSPAAEILHVKARRAQVLWAISRVWPLRDRLWITADAAVQMAWEKSMATLGSPSADGAVGLLGEPGPRQKLTLVVPGSPWVAKTALGPSARRSIEREANNYDLLEASGLLQCAVPSHKRVGDVLLIERLEGSHPSWASGEAARWILESLLEPDGGAIQHGDVTPWNVMQTHDGYRLLDWEDAEPTGRVDPLHNLLDFVLRGAAVARAAPARVNSFIGDYLPNCRADILNSYETYRRELTAGRIDALQGRVQRYLRSLGKSS